MGKLLIQVPFTPDNKLAVQASTGDGGVVIIDAVGDEVLKRIKTHAGAHGVAIGDKVGYPFSFPQDLGLIGVIGGLVCIQSIRLRARTGILAERRYAVVLPKAA